MNALLKNDVGNGNYCPAQIWKAVPKDIRYIHNHGIDTLLGF
jgi:hypothetical protein